MYLTFRLHYQNPQITSAVFPPLTKDKLLDVAFLFVSRPQELYYSNSPAVHTFVLFLLRSFGKFLWFVLILEPLKHLQIRTSGFSKDLIFSGFCLFEMGFCCLERLNFSPIFLGVCYEFPDWWNEFLSFVVWILSVYPKVKVRGQQEYDDQYDFESRSLHSLKALECLSLDDLSSPGKFLPHSFLLIITVDL